MNDKYDDNVSYPCKEYNSVYAIKLMKRNCFRRVFEIFNQ